MAAFQSAQWTVMVLVESDPSFNKMYQLSSKTSLANLMKVWRDDFGLYGNWIFLSDDGNTLFENDGMTLEMIGESKPNTKIVNLRAEILSEAKSKSFSEIFVHRNDECQNMEVNTQQTLYDDIRRPPRRLTSFEHNGAFLHPKQTLEEVSIKDKSFIHECSRPITVKLSTGHTTIIDLPSNSLVLQLLERVRYHEIEDFSLEYQGRYLFPHETVKQLKHVVEVKREEFVVHIDKQSFRWRSQSAPISFPEFISTLSVKGQLDIQNLQSMKFQCVGCQRSICQSESHHQLLPIQCCKEKSLTLIAESNSNSDANSRTHMLTKYIQCLNEHLVRHRAMDSMTEAVRDKCRNVKEKILENGFDYNAFIQCSEGYRGDILQLLEKIKTWENVNEILRDKNERLTNSNDKLNEENNKLHETIEKLKEEYNTLYEKNNELYEKNNMLHENNKELKETNSMVLDDHKKLQPDINMLNDENIMLDEENNKLNEENNKLKDKNVKLMDQNEKLKNTNAELTKENDRLKIENNERKDMAAATLPPIPKAPTDTTTVKLAILFDPTLFVTSQPYRAVKLGYHSCIKVEILGLKPGWRRFKEVKHALLTFFSLGWRFYVDIQDILQLRSSLDGQEVAEVTSHNTDEFQTELELKEFCSENGEVLSWEVAGKPRKKHRCCAGDRVFICGDGRRTVLQISHL